MTLDVQYQPTTSLGDLFSLEGRTALVTGGGAGLGRQMTYALAGAGANVTICGRRMAPLETTAAELLELGLDIQFVQADITMDADIDRIADVVDRVDVLVNNAGYALRDHWSTVTLDRWREVCGVNVEAPLRLMQRFVPGMVERGWGRVINVASVYGSNAGDERGYPGLGLDIASYFASKHALIGLTRFMAVQLARTGVTVNTLSPGMFPSPLVDTAVADAIAQQIPTATFGSATDLEAAVLFLAGPGSPYVTGTDIVVDGGWSTW